MRITKVLSLSAFVILSACGGDRLSFKDLIGNWSSNDGFSVTLQSNKSYQFCDKSNCFRGELFRPGSERGFAVELKGFFDHPETDRLRSRLKSFGYDFENSYQKFPTLDFTVTSYNNRKNWCDNRPCVLFGSVEDEDHLIFLKRE